MRILYIECGMGAAGDMLTAALTELTKDPEKTLGELNSIGLPGVRFVAEKSEKCGIVGTHMRVFAEGEEEEEAPDHGHDHSHDHDHHHAHDHGHHHPHVHRKLSQVEEIVRELQVSDEVKANVTAVFQSIAEAEGKVHGKPVSEIHFHEVGTMDAIADVTAVCYLMEKLGNPRVIASPVHVGRGTVRCAHGVLPVPAPATALLLEGLPIYSRPEIEGELCTPTGAALLRHFASEFREMPVMRTGKIGYGMGKKDFPRANCVRAFLGETAEAGQSVLELNFNVDDMTGEEIGFATEQILAGGAREVFTTAVGMKKGRPGILVTVLVTEDLKEKILELIFRHTTTLGVRETVCKRYMLDRKITEEETPYGVIRKKTAEGYGVSRSKYEYEDLRKAALENGCSIREILEGITGEAE